MNTASLKITPEMLRLIADIDEFKGAWRAMTALAPERLAGHDGAGAGTAGRPAARRHD